MEGNEEEGSLASFLPRDVSSRKSERFLPSVMKIDRIRWPTILRENSNEWINSRKGIDLFISWCWIEFLSPSIKTFKMVETLVERIARCVNGALILTKRPRAQIFHLPWSLRAIMLFKSFPLLLVSFPFHPHPVSISRNKKYLVESDNAEWRFLESRGEFLISSAIHDNNNAL